MGTHTLAPGTVLGRYELLLPIAQGGMATVWAARQRGSRGFSKTVAVKTILPNLSDDPQFEQMFLDEAAIASRIHHPNVAEILDLGEQDEVLYLVMEWVDGESLSTLSKHARKNGSDIPLRVGTKAVMQACAGLHAAHELRDDSDQLVELVHRDVSPQNILLSSGGVVKIVDFGVAKALGRSGETSAGQLKGKVPFMSPEQAKGAAVDRRTDIFALGIILYRMVTGAHPFLDDNDIKTMRNIITRPPMPPRVKNPKLSHEMERVVLKALQKDPARRHQTAAELASEIEAALLHEGGRVTDEEVSTFVRATLGERDRKRRAAIRDAALKMDESGLVSSPGVPSHPGGESVSAVMLTTTATPPTSLTGAEVTAAIPFRSSSPSLPSSPGTPPGSVPPLRTPADARAGSARQSEPQLPSSPTLASSPTMMATVASAAGTGRTSRKTKVVAIALAIVGGVGLGVVAVSRVGPTEPAAPAAASMQTPASATSEAAAAPPSAPLAEAAAAPDASSGTDLSIDELPDHRGKVAPPGGRRRAQPTAEPTATAAAVAAPAAPPPTSKPGANGPAVQDPGF